jgi:hypothetical protein
MVLLRQIRYLQCTFRKGKSCQAKAEPIIRTHSFSNTIVSRGLLYNIVFSLTVIDPTNKNIGTHIKHWQTERYSFALFVQQYYQSIFSYTKIKKITFLPHCVKNTG